MLTLAQIGLALVIAPKDFDSGRTYLKVFVPAGYEAHPQGSWLRKLYLRLNNWDSLHFFEIAKNGYHLPNRAPQPDDVHHYEANEAFLPSVPILARGFSEATGISLQLSLIVVAQICALAFWYLFLILLELRGFPLSQARNVAVIGALHPAAFYLVMGYTESFFVMTMFLVVYFTERWIAAPRADRIIIPSLSGFAMTASRMVALPAATYPAFRALFSWKALSTSRKTGLLLISAIGAGGLAAFFAYCWYRFGEWNLYFRLLAQAYDQKNEYFLFLFDPRTYLPRFFFEETLISINRSALPMLIAASVIVARRSNPLTKDRLRATIATAALMTYTCAVGKVDFEMIAMIRYTLPPFLLVLTELSPNAAPLSARARRWLAFSLLLLFATQTWLARRFLIGHWVS